MGNLPTRFYIAQGFGVDDEDKVNAYDNALYHMGLADQNMRYVSSVPPQTQLHDVLSREGYSFIPVPKGWVLQNPKDYELWRRHGQIVHHTKVPNGVPTQESHASGLQESIHKYYFLMGTSWCTDVVMTEMRGDAGEYLASGLGIGQYEKYDGTIGTFAFENHGYVDSESCADKTAEGILKMIEMRGHTPVKREVTFPNYREKHVIGTLDRVMTGTKLKRYAKKEVFRHKKLAIDTYITSMVVPEGHCGVVLTACVFDPFTEIRALSPSIIL